MIILNHIDLFRLLRQRSKRIASGIDVQEKDLEEAAKQTAKDFEEASLKELEKFQSASPLTGMRALIL